MIFSDGVEADFLEFTSGAVATVQLAQRHLNLVQAANGGIARVIQSSRPCSFREVARRINLHIAFNCSGERCCSLASAREGNGPKESSNCTRIVSRHPASMPFSNQVVFTVLILQ